MSWLRPRSAGPCRAPTSADRCSGRARPSSRPAVCSLNILAHTRSVAKTLAPAVRARGWRTPRWRRRASGCVYKCGRSYPSGRRGCSGAAVLPASVRLLSDIRNRLGRRAVTFSDPVSGACRGCRGTTRGTSIAGLWGDVCFPGVPAAAFVQAERPGRPGGPLLIRGFGVQVPGGAPVRSSRFSEAYFHVWI